MMIQDLSKLLGYQFSELPLLEMALSHRSIQKRNNERLEFLGDSILNFTIAENLYMRFPNAAEGELSRLRAALVNEDILAEIAKTLKLGDYLILGPGELKSGGMRRKSILADALEAIIAAIYLDSDMQTCQKVLLAWFSEKLNQIDSLKGQKDPKSRLQEYLQSHRMELPVYEIIEITGKAHEQYFRIRCTVAGLPHETEGEGYSRREAERIAAEAFLELIVGATGGRPSS